MTMPSLVANRVEFADLSAGQRRFDHAVGSMIGLEEDAPNGLAGWADFREFRFKGVANELAAGIKRKIDGRSV
jgi:hypothetical protein